MSSHPVAVTACMCLLLLTLGISRDEPDVDGVDQVSWNLQGEDSLDCTDSVTLLSRALKSLHLVHKEVLVS